MQTIVLCLLLQAQLALPGQKLINDKFEFTSFAGSLSQNKYLYLRMTRDAGVIDVNNRPIHLVDLTFNARVEEQHLGNKVKPKQVVVIEDMHLVQGPIEYNWQRDETSGSMVYRGDKVLEDAQVESLVKVCTEVAKQYFRGKKPNEDLRKKVYDAVNMSPQLSVVYSEQRPVRHGFWKKLEGFLEDLYH